MGARRSGRVKRVVTGDLWTDARLLDAEELAAAARARTAQRALRQAARPDEGRGRRRGTVRRALGRWLLGSAPGSADPA
jgi:hypothetical protein